MYYYGNKIMEKDKMKNISWTHKETPQNPTKNVLRKMGFLCQPTFFPGLSSD
jgi:hypothetical protein